MGAEDQQTPTSQQAPTTSPTPVVVLAGASVDGAVSAITIAFGQQVEAERTIVALAVPDERIVRATMPQSQGSRGVNGMPAAIRQRDGTAPHPAVVLEVQDCDREPIVATGVDWGGTRPWHGTDVEASVTLANRADALIVPRSAIRDDQGARYVEAIDGEVRRIDVATGLEIADDVEIVAGLREGQVVHLT